ncbi:hypothetical protein BDZ45DRAFT_673474 [Acephala macrosclerotiorum]|nr:hypothetical protein BDZ45DRAFT_673474 [Acephala macrosclerotiorum]
MSPSKDNPTAPAKIAIKGFSLSSKPSSSKPGAGAKQKQPPASSLGKRPRSTFAHHDDSGSDSDDGHRRHGKVEAVHGFADGGAVEVRDKERKGNGPLVIPKQVNRDWKAEARGRRSGVVMRGSARNLLPPEVQAAQEAARREREGFGKEGKRKGVDVVNSNDGEIEWGLSVRKRVKVDDEPVHEENGEEANTAENGHTNGESRKEAEEEKPKTADEEALAALLGQDKVKKGPDLVIGPSNPDFAPPPPMSETDAYRRAIEVAPDVSTLEDYERIPVEEFGAALLRGMGWKGESHGKVKDVKRRQNLLGLGAKELKEAEELGAWVHKSDVKRLNPGGDKKGGGHGSGERRPKASEYKREEERRREKREERGGGSYRREKERDSGHRGSGREEYRNRDRDRDRDRRR